MKFVSLVSSVRGEGTKNHLGVVIMGWPEAERHPKPAPGSPTLEERGGRVKNGGLSHFQVQRGKSGFENQGGVDQKRPAKKTFPAKKKSPWNRRRRTPKE